MSFKMSAIALSFYMCFVSVPVFAKKTKPPTGEVVIMTSKKGQVDLVSDKKLTKTVASLDQARVELKNPKSIFKLLGGYKALVVSLGSDQFSFFIPRSSVNAKGEFRVHKKYTGQNYNVQLLKSAKDLTSAISERVIDCTYETSDLEPQYSTDSDGNSVTNYVWVTNSHSGRQKAVVNDQVWMEKSLITVYDDTNQIRFETSFSQKKKTDVVKELTTCR